MYEKGKEGSDEHYFSVGLQALAIIDKARALVNKNEVGSLLDFGCGYGRVLRFLKAYFPETNITCSEVEPTYVEYCAETFDVENFVSNTDFTKLNRDKKYDIIWSGSVFTHLSASKFEELFQYFEQSLNAGGIMVFTTHGRFCMDNLKQHGYGLSRKGKNFVRLAYQFGGYGYHDYTFAKGYGISMMKAAWLMNFLDKKTNVCLIALYEKYWDNHQDVVIIQKI